MCGYHGSRARANLQLLQLTPRLKISMSWDVSSRNVSHEDYDCVLRLPDLVRKCTWHTGVRHAAAVQGPDAQGREGGEGRT